MKTDDPRERMGVYEQLCDVPSERRLERFAGSYNGRDTWAEAVDAWDVSDRQREILERTGRSWKDHMADRGRHHALARPDDCEAWAESMLAEYAPSTIYHRYWSKIRRFYEWLQWHPEHPHLYEPPLMAIVENPDGAAAELWREERGNVDRMRETEANQ